MATYAATKQSSAPTATLNVPPTSWQTANVDVWNAVPGGRPRGPVVIGLRRLSDGDMQAARALAAKTAHDDYRCRACETPTSVSDQIDAFNDTLIHIAVGRSACLTTDAAMSFFEREEADVKARMTPEGARMIWDAIERLHLVDSPITEPASDDDLVSLSMRLALPESFTAVPEVRALRLRKLATFMLGELRTFEQTSE